MARPPIDEEFLPPPPEPAAHRTVADFLDDGSRTWLLSRTGNRVELPADLVALLRDAAATLAGGRGVHLRSLPDRYTLAEVAQMADLTVDRLRRHATELGMSPADDEVTLAQALALRDRVMEYRQALFEEMAAADQELGNLPEDR